MTVSPSLSSSPIRFGMAMSADAAQQTIHTALQGVRLSLEGRDPQRAKQALYHASDLILQDTQAPPVERAKRHLGLLDLAPQVSAKFKEPALLTTAIDEVSRLSEKALGVIAQTAAARRDAALIAFIRQGALNSPTSFRIKPLLVWTWRICRRYRCLRPR